MTLSLEGHDTLISGMEEWKMGWYFSCNREYICF